MRAADYYKRAGWWRRAIREALSRMESDTVCATCGGIGYVIDPAKRPANQPCPACS